MALSGAVILGSRTPKDDIHVCEGVREVCGVRVALPSYAPSSALVEETSRASLGMNASSSGLL